MALQATFRYRPPPPTVAPPTGWRPPQVVAMPPPRALPEQDHATIDAAEQRARRFTATVGAVAATVVILLFAVLCGQLIR